ncbi:hypothetical protein EI94DRAFT_1794507 [Lactarius quietus]|nr:hypothetical protein EI94DRAFT_1794507 [Lactarius quietus]
MSDSCPTNELTFANRIGLLILFEISLVSASAISILLVYIAYSTVSVRSGSQRRWKIESSVHLFLLNQLFFDLLLALGGLMNMKWVVDAKVSEGSFCVAQGVIKQLADVGTALSAGNIAIYTFSALIFRLNPNINMFRASLIVAGIWIAIFLDIAINVGIHGFSKFYSSTEYWCWISNAYPAQQTYADYMWMWISAFSSLLAYVAVFLVLRGFVTPHTQAYKMLAYPIVYIITVLPVSAARYRTIGKRHLKTPFVFTAIADGFFLSSGLLNVLLYAYTRPYLLPHNNDSADDQSIALHSEFAQSRSNLPVLPRGNGDPALSTGTLSKKG